MLGDNAATNCHYQEPRSCNVLLGESMEGATVATLNGGTSCVAHSVIILVCTHHKKLQLSHTSFGRFCTSKTVVLKAGPPWSFGASGPTETNEHPNIRPHFFEASRMAFVVQQTCSLGPAW
jgi:hypothetical protein